MVKMRRAINQEWFVSSLYISFVITFSLCVLVSLFILNNNCQLNGFFNFIRLISRKCCLVIVINMIYL